MSNIFEALNRGKGALADSILPLINMPQEPSEIAREEYRAQAIALPRSVSSFSRAESPEGDLSATQIRCLPLRIPAPSPLLPFEDRHSEVSEQYRILRTKIGQHPKKPRLIVISSPAAKDGKSVTAVNLAGVLVLKAEGKVLLLDADMRRATIHFQLGLPKAPGLADILKGTCAVEQALVQTQAYPNLYVLSAGTPPTNPAELLDNARWPALCARLRTQFQYMIVDSPPLAALADFDLIEAVCDGIILVIRPDRTDRSLCRKALETVPKAKFLGVVLNCVPEWFLRKDHHDAYYYESAQSKAQEHLQAAATSEEAIL